MSNMTALRDIANKVCEHLPEGYYIEIHLENGSGYVELFDSEGGEIDFPTNRENLCDELEDALTHALEISGNIKVWQSGEYEGQCE